MRAHPFPVRKPFTFQAGAEFEPEKFFRTEGGDWTGEVGDNSGRDKTTRLVPVVVPFLMPRECSDL
jgi:hypothetical protein